MESIPANGEAKSRPVEIDGQFELFASEPNDISRLQFIGSSIGANQRRRNYLHDSLQLTWSEKYPRRAEWLKQNGYTMQDAVNANDELNDKIRDVPGPSNQLNVSGPDVDQITAAAERFRATASGAAIEAAPKLTSVDLRALLILAEILSHGKSEVEWASVAAILGKECDDPQFVYRAKKAMVANGFLTEIGIPHKIANRYWFRIEPCVAQETRRIWELLGPDVKDQSVDGPVPEGFRWKGTVFDGLKGKAWLLTEYLWGRRGKVVSDKDLANGNVWDDVSDVTENSVGALRRTANKFFDANCIPLKIKTENHCRQIFLKDEPSP